MKIPNAKYHLSAAEKVCICFKRVVHSVAHYRNSTIVFRIRNLLCNVPDGKHASRGKNDWKLEDMIILYIIWYDISYMIILWKQKLFLKIFHVLQLLFCCFDPPPWRGNIYDVVKREPHPVASRSNKPQLWILDIVRKFCQRITVFLSKDFQCVNVFLSSALHLLRYPHQWYTWDRQLSLR